MNLKKYFKSILLIGLFILPTTVLADEVSNQVRPITSIDIIGACKLALKNYEVVSIGRETVVQGKEDIWKVLSQIMPLITVDGRYTTYSEQKESSSGFLIQPEDSAKVDVKLVQPLYSGGRATSAYKQAKKSLEIKKNLFELTKEEVIILTSTSFYNVLKAKGDVAIKLSAHKRALKHKKSASLRLKVGSGTRADLLSAEAEEAGASAELIRAESGLIDSYIVLGRLIGGNLTSSFKLIEPKPTALELKDVEVYIIKAIEGRRELKNSLAEKIIAEQGVRFVKGSFLPALSLEGQYSYREQTPETTFFQNEQSSASLVMRYPIFEGGLRKAELDEAVSKLRQSELRLALTKKDIEVDVRRSYNDVVYLNNLIKSFSKQRDFAYDNYQIVFKQYNLGLASTVEVTNADSLLVTSERDYLAVKFDYELALLNLKKSTASLNIFEGNDSGMSKSETGKNINKVNVPVTNDGVVQKNMEDF